MSTALSVAMDERSLEEIDKITRECSLEALAEVSGLKRTFAMATGINSLRRAISEPMLNELMNLQGSSLGFRTDRDDKGGYDRETVKECAIECLLRGGQWVGNEMNIIASRCYLTKEYFTRKVREFPGLTDLKLFPGVPQTVGDKGALVPYAVTWKLNGVPDRIDRKQSSDLDERIAVRVNGGMGTDAVLGKAERKMLAAVYKRLTGSDVTDGEVGDEPLTVAARQKPVSSLEALTDKLEQKPEPAAPTFDLAAVEARFAACRSFTDVGKLMTELRGSIPEQHKADVAIFDELARERVRAELQAAKKQSQDAPR